MSHMNNEYYQEMKDHIKESLLNPDTHSQRETVDLKEGKKTWKKQQFGADLTRQHLEQYDN